jgi:hypothetical protein
MSNLIGTNADQVPTCGMLGTAAFMDASQITALGTASLLTSITPTNGVTSVSLTSLKPYNLLRIGFNSVGTTSSNVVLVSVSSDNGSTYSTEGIHPDNGPLVVGWVDITGGGVVGNKLAIGSGSTALPISSVTGIVNAIRFSVNSSGTFDGTGNIYIYGIN